MMRPTPASLLFSFMLCAVIPVVSLGAEGKTTLRGEIRDATSGQLLPARVYVQSGADWFFVRSASPQGSAVEYRKSRNNMRSVEFHTTLSAHPFVAELPPGQYTITVERGKEYLPARQKVTVGSEPVAVTVKLRRWVDMASRGWYSGDTHVHRTLKELPNVMLAEDLNVALPLTGWVTEAYDSPMKTYRLQTGRVEAKLIEVDPTHVIYPLNTEWEIFRVNGKSHTQGAVFALNQKRPSDLGTPPVRPLAHEARRQGALLDLDKHNWPWSMMVVPIMEVDLFELTNNHIWRTDFAFYSWYKEYEPEYMNLKMRPEGWTEQGWIDYGLKTYYALLNCGFKLRPTGGTASGVHPVPLGFGRVYVKLFDTFNYDDWIDGLNAGHSFVTTGPMLDVRCNGRISARNIAIDRGMIPKCRFTGAAESASPLDRIELIVNGQIVRTLKPANEKTQAGGYRSPIDEEVPIHGSSWVAVRCFESHPRGAIRFAHTAPFHFIVSGKPLHPRKEETAYLVKRLEEELARNEKVLPAAALKEFREALEIYRELDERAK